MVDPEQPAHGESLGNIRRIFWQRLKGLPLHHVIWYLLENPYYLWNWDSIEGQGDINVYLVTRSLYTAYWPANLLRLLMKALHPIVILSALGAIVLLVRRRRLAPGAVGPADGGALAAAGAQRTNPA